MLSKLKTADDIIKNETARYFLDNWVNNNLNDRNVNYLIDWYRDRGLNKSLPGSIYRGITLHKGINYSKLFNGGIIELNDRRGFDSWTSNPHIAITFARKGTSKTPGVVISRRVGTKTKYVDINKSYDFLGEKIPYPNECEFIMVPSCKKCSINKDVEFFLLTNDVWTFEKVCKESMVGRLMGI